MSLQVILPKLALRYSLVLVLSLIVLLVACTGSTPETTRQVTIGDVQVTGVPPTQMIYAFKTSEPGTITIHGFLVVLNPISMIPAPGDSIYLVSMPVAETISGIPQFEPSQVPQADVNESTGEFVFTNIQPNQYAVVVVTSGGAQIPVRYMDTSNYVIFTLDTSQADTTVNLGELTLP